MSFAVHDSQPSQSWNGSVYTPNKRKHTTINRHEEARSNTSSDQQRKEPGRVVYKRNTTASNSSSRGSSPESITVVNQFLIDGTIPTQPSPQLLEKKTETRHGPGRHRSVDLKGLIMELIDETYPPLVCPTCLHTASARSEADLHFKTEHHGKKVFKCVHTRCDQSYSSKPGLRYHLEHAHQVTLNNLTERNTTTINNKSFKSFKSLKSSNITTTISTPIATIKSTTNNSNNNSHHHKESNHGESNSKRLKKQELSSGLQKMLDETYDITICPSCKEQFKRKTHVIRHLVDVHHGEEPYKCVVSNCKRTKTYATREGLIYHLVSYHDEMQH